MNQTKCPTPKVRRGFSISQGNEEIVSEARQEILGKMVEAEKREKVSKDATRHTFLLPKLIDYPFKFRAFLENDLVEQAVLINLEQTYRLNWWCDNDCMQRLWPLATTGDGNCLLHAASLAMWGFHDRHLTLRHALHHRLIHDNVSFYRRWIYQSVQDHKEQGFSLSHKEYEEEWSEICNLSFPSPKGSHTHFDLFPKEYDEAYLSCCQKDELVKGQVKETSIIRNVSPSKNFVLKKNQKFSPIIISSRDGYYDFLEQIHVFVLSQVLRRPIIIISDTYVRDADGQPIQPLLFGGIYLPLLEKPEDCEKSPILLTYSNSHFSALVPMNLEETVGSKPVPLAVPLIDPISFELLPIHFCIDPGEAWINSDFSSFGKKVHLKNIMKTYLDCEEFKFCPYHKRRKEPTEILGDDYIDSITERQKHSLTRNIGKQIKEKFSSKAKSKSAPIANNTSVTKTQSINWDKFCENDSVFGAKLRIHLTSNYYEMIDNYMKDAKSNFETLQSKSRRASIEFMSKVNAEKVTNIICKNCKCVTIAQSKNVNKLCLKCTNDEISKRISHRQCLESMCTSISIIENYCLKCYNNLPICKTEYCSSKAVTNGLCVTCASKFRKN